MKRETETIKRLKKAAIHIREEAVRLELNSEEQREQKQSSQAHR